MKMCATLPPAPSPGVLYGFIQSLETLLPKAISPSGGCVCAAQPCIVRGACRCILILCVSVRALCAPRSTSVLLPAARCALLPSSPLSMRVSGAPVHTAACLPLTSLLIVYRPPCGQSSACSSSAPACARGQVQRATGFEYDQREIRRAVHIW